MPSLRECIEGGLVGLLVGDALGVPYEFSSAELIPPLDAIEMQPPIGFRRAHQGVPIGTWSDDGAQALCLLASLLENGTFDPRNFAKKLIAWSDHGYMAVDNIVFDIGITTHRAISTLRAGADPLTAGPDGAYDNGNGALMRVLPLALWHIGTDAELIRDADLQSRITHGHIRSRICCALYCVWARNILRGIADPWQQAVDELWSHYDDNDEAMADLEFEIQPDVVDGGAGSGYVVDALRSAHWAFRLGAYERVVRFAISLGNDTDTTACIAGGVAGTRDGISAIPERWRTALRGKELYEPLLHRLLRHHGL